MGVMGDACAPLDTPDGVQTLTAAEEELHKALGHAKHERRAALGSYDEEAPSESRKLTSRPTFFSRAFASKDGLRTLSRVVRAAAPACACCGARARRAALCVERVRAAPALSHTRRGQGRSCMRRR